MRDCINEITQDDVAKQTLLSVLRTPPPRKERMMGFDKPASQKAPLGRRYWVVTLAMVALLFCCALFGLMVGSVTIPAPVALTIFTHWLSCGLVFEQDWRTAYEIISVQTRISRVILAGIVGASLGDSGMVIQAIVRNPFAGGLMALTIVFWIARTGGHIAPTRLVLAGVAISAVLSALTSLMVLTSPDPQLASRVLFWTLGGFGSAQWQLLPVPALALSIGLAIMLIQSRQLNLLMSEDESAVALGLDVERFRRQMFLLTAALTGVTVAISGVIGFVGLIMPHIVRLLVGSEHRRALPTVALLGASFTIAADLIARSVIAPLELPVGIVTALVGGPFFVWLLRRDARSLGVTR